MNTSYDIDKTLYRSLKAAVQAHTIPINGGVYNGDRPLNSKAEDITVRSLSVVSDGFPQDAVVNVNVYVPDIAEGHGGYVRDGARLDVLSKSVMNYLSSLVYDCVDVYVDNVTEIDEQEIHQHYVNFRVRLYINADL